MRLKRETTKADKSFFFVLTVLNAMHKESTINITFDIIVVLNSSLIKPDPKSFSSFKSSFLTYSKEKILVTKIRLSPK